MRSGLYASTYGKSITMHCSYEGNESFACTQTVTFWSNSDWLDEIYLLSFITYQ